MSFKPQYEQRLQSALQNFNLTRPEWAVINFVGGVTPFESISDAELCIDLIEGYCGGPKLTKSLIRGTTAKLLDKGLLQVITADVLAEITIELQQKRPIIMTPWTLPSEGQFDLTAAGAELYLNLFKAVKSDGEPTPIVSVCLDDETPDPVILASDRAWATQAVYDFVCCMEERCLTYCSEAESVGSWYERWWLEHPDGWRIRMHVEPYPRTSPP
jgi:hypothetical protein